MNVNRLAELFHLRELKAQGLPEVKGLKMAVNTKRLDTNYGLLVGDIQTTISRTPNLTAGISSLTRAQRLLEVTKGLTALQPSLFDAADIQNVLYPTDPLPFIAHFDASRGYVMACLPLVLAVQGPDTIIEHGLQSGIPDQIFRALEVDPASAKDATQSYEDAMRLNHEEYKRILNDEDSTGASLTQRHGRDLAEKPRNGTPPLGSVTAFELTGARLAERVHGILANMYSL